MLPEVTSERTEDGEFLFGVQKKNNLEEDCKEYKSAVPRSRSYGHLANVVLKSVSKYSLAARVPLDDIKNQISEAGKENEITTEEAALLEAAVDQIEKCEALKDTVGHRESEQDEILIGYVMKLFSLLKTILFGNVRASARNVQTDNVGLVLKTESELALDPPLSSPEEQDSTESAEEKLRRILLDSHNRIKKQYESKLCACKNDQETLRQQESDIEVKSVDGLLCTVRKSQSSMPQDSGINEALNNLTSASFPVIDVEHLVSDKPTLQKFKNEEDLTAVGFRKLEANIKFSKFTQSEINVLSASKFEYKFPIRDTMELRKSMPGIEKEIDSSLKTRDLDDDGYLHLVSSSSPFVHFHISISLYILQLAKCTVEHSQCSFKLCLDG
jgi:hypothetical protein